MATIITVHGTNATGPECGDRWWQRGSPFENHLSELLAGEDGRLKFQPFVWDGINSENSRRRAGSRLLSVLKRLEAEKERYVVVGHSHGGSVIANALAEAASTTAELPQFGRWITVGTPFLLFSNSLDILNVFSAAGRAGKALFVSLITGLFLLSFVVYSAIQQMPQPPTGQMAFLLYGVVWTLLALPFLILYSYWAVSAIIRRYRSQRWKRFRGTQNSIFNKWIGLCHKRDEALQGLRSLRNLKISIFPDDFIVPPLTYLAAFAIPLLIPLVALSETLTLAIFSLVPFNPSIQTPGLIENGQLVGGGREFVTNIKVLSAALLYSVWYPVTFLTNPVAYYSSLDTQTASLVILIAIILVIFPLAIFAFSWVSIRLIPLLSRPISKILNQMTWTQIKKSMLGDDVSGENAIDAQNFPVWAEKAFAFIPDELGNEISETSDRSAAKSLAKFRAAFEAEAFGANRTGLSAFADYVSWEELIHTCYFQVPRFRKLVAYAISTAEGFRPTEQFRADADYALVEQWHQKIISEPVVSFP
jgi:hypothetical protein